MDKKIKQAANMLLNLRCAETKKDIQVNEVVKIHNWGSTREVVCYGHFEWCEEDRAFRFVPQQGMNIKFLGGEQPTIEDSYDLFRTSPEKLNQDELDYFINELDAEIEGEE